MGSPLVGCVAALGLASKYFASVLFDICIFSLPELLSFVGQYFAYRCISSWSFFIFYPVTMVSLHLSINYFV